MAPPPPEVASSSVTRNASAQRPSLPVARRDRITRLVISSDCRWLLSSSLDGCVRVWDIPAGQCLQAMAMGSPVTSLSLSPARDLLATTHVHKRGVFLWSNQLMFGDAAGVVLNANKPVPVALPSIATGAQAAQQQQRDGAQAPDGAVAMAVDGEEGPEASSSDEFYGHGGESSSEDESEDEGGADSSGRRQRQQQRRKAEGAAAEAEEVPLYQRTSSAGGGAPVPLSPELVTLSLLPRAQWETLLHLDAIKARSKPIQAPKKPEAAPFFLPTVPGLEGNPVFDTAAAAQGGAAAAATTVPADGAGGGGALAGWGGEDDEAEVGVGGDGPAEDGEEQQPAAAAARTAPGSRVVRTKPSQQAQPVGTFLRLLRACGDAGEYSSFMGHVRSLSPAALDRELRSMVLLEGSSEREVEDVRLLLECLEAEVAGARNYEFCQALLQHVLAVSGGLRWRL